MQDKEIIQKWLEGLSKEQSGRFITQYEALSKVEQVIYKYLKRK